MQPPGSPRYAQAPTFMRLPSVLAPTGRDAVVIGAPYDGGASYRPGTRLAPSAIRHESYLIHGASGPDVFGGIDVVDGADIDPGSLSGEMALANANAVLSELLRDNDAFLVLGGDRSISLPAISAVHERHGQLAVLRLDAHGDTFPVVNRGFQDNAMPFRQGLEDSLIHGPGMIQIGVREQNPESLDLSRGHGVTVITALSCAAEHGIRKAVDRIREVVGDRPLYVSVDVAVADPVSAPGTAMPVPGGLSRHDVLELLDVVGELNPVGFDVVGVCPPFDPSGITALLAAEIGAQLLYQYGRAATPMCINNPDHDPVERKGKK